jgi:heat shock protein HtpX
MENAYGLYSHIRSNRIRSIFLLFGLFLLIYILLYAGALVAEVYLHSSNSLEVIMLRAKYDFFLALPYATAGAIVWIVIAYFFHQNMIDAVTGGEVVTRTDQPRLYNLLENMCISRGIPMPKLKVMDTSALNAFATGLNQRQYSITVTTGLIKSLNDAEMEAVLGHELTHIRNGDVQLMVVAMIIAGVVSFFGEMIFRMFTNNSGFRFSGRSSSSSSSSSSDRKGGGGAVVAILIAIALIMVAWLLSQVVKMALSRSREYLADAGSVELTKNPDAMITALRKIEGRGELPGSTSAVMEMCIDNPRSGFSDLFSTHPSVDSRVDKLVHFAGGHDPGPIALPAPKDDENETKNDDKDDNSGDDSEESRKPNPWGDQPQSSRGPWGGRGA